MQDPGPRTRKETSGRTQDLGIPDDLRRRLEPWIDVREVGADGFWMWLGTVIALLPDPTLEPPEPSMRVASVEDRQRGLARDLVDCARERARLTVMSDQYFRDNQTLSVRLKAVEAALKTAREAGRAPAVAADAKAAAAAERYLPGRTPR